MSGFNDIETAFLILNKIEFRIKKTFIHFHLLDIHHFHFLN